MGRGELGAVRLNYRVSSSIPFIPVHRYTGILLKKAEMSGMPLINKSGIPIYLNLPGFFYSDISGMTNSCTVEKAFVKGGGDYGKIANANNCVKFAQFLQNYMGSRNRANLSALSYLHGMRNSAISPKMYIFFFFNLILTWENLAKCFGKIRN